MKKTSSTETLIAQAMHFVDADNGAVIPPIQLATTYARDRDYALINPAHSYTRDHNPTYKAAESMLAALEEGEEALLFSSGMAAACMVFQCLHPGAKVLVPRVMYWGLRGWLVEFCKTWGIELAFYDAADAADLERCLADGGVNIVWVETPTNPTWEVTDIRRAADLAHAAGALLVVDSTVATPVLTKPLTLGADIVMHSATKYLNGHGDVLAGALVTAKIDDFWQRVRRQRGESGAIPGPFEAWLLQRGMRTLFLRMRQISDSALQVAQRLEAHPAVAQVLYPGLPSHPSHEVASRQMSGGFSGMLSIRLKGGAEKALQVAGACNVFIRATSLGGVESLIEHRASIEGADSPIPADMLRLSIGIEKVEDLINDLEQALG